jgi:hypothetical protein
MATAPERLTEAEWLVRTGSYKMLDFLSDRKVAASKAGRRKLRLFACACCRHAWSLLDKRASKQAVETAERFADGQADARELKAAWDAAWAAMKYPYKGPPRRWSAFWAAAYTAHPRAFAAASSVAGYLSQTRDHYLNGNPAHAELLRDIFGNPFQPTTVDPAWRTAAVIELARSMYEARAFTRMRALGKALAQAGCSDAAILEHCRRPGKHVRGCWVVDLLLGKIRPASPAGRDGKSLKVHPPPAR